MENIRDIIRQWAADFNRRHREAEQTRSDAAKKAETFNESARKRTEIVLEVAEHWGDSVDISEAAWLPNVRQRGTAAVGPRRAACPRGSQITPAAAPRDTSAAEKWAALSAIHDTFWFGETINPWPVPHDYYVAPLPTNGDAIARRKKFGRRLLLEVKLRRRNNYPPTNQAVPRRSLKELVAKPDDGEGNG